MASDRVDDAAADEPADDALLAAVFAALPELVFVLDRDGTYVDVLGGRDDARYHDGRALIGQRLHDVLPEDRADEFLERIRAALDSGQVVRHEYRLSVHDVDGVEPDPDVQDDLWFEGRAAPLAPESGHDDVVVWLAFNVTESRLQAQQLEEQTRQLQRQTAELERHARARQRLLSAVSHDLRGPLTSVRGALELLDARRDQLDPDQAHDLLLRASAGAARMEEMIADLLTTSRREHVELSPAPQAVSMAETVRAVVDGADDEGHAVELDLDEDQVYADASHVERIVVNLVDNARKYGAPPVQISTRRDGESVQLRVRDHGDGVPDAFVPELFTAFTQAGHPGTAADGVGLGLSIVQQLAHVNGGTVAWEPTDDGACFVVTLPAVPSGTGSD